MTVFYDRTAVIFVRESAKVLGKAFTDLTIEFNAEKNSEANPNKGNIKIYNANAESRALFQKKPLIVVLAVGYGGVVKNLFQGDVIKTFTNRVGKDYITQFELGDGELAYKRAKIDVTRTGPVTIEQLIRTTAETFGFPIKTKGIPAKNFDQGYTLSGNSRDVMDEITKTANLEWSIQDGEIQIMPSNVGSVTQAQAVVLNSRSGLIGNPTLRLKDDGVEFTTLINPDIKPGGFVKLESNIFKSQDGQIRKPETDGFYRVRRCTYTGNNRGGPWFIKCEALLPGQFL